MEEIYERGIRFVEKIMKLEAKESDKYNQRIIDFSFSSLALHVEDVKNAYFNLKLAYKK